jgi:hypothetical protein
MKIGKYLTLEEFCTCTKTYHKYQNQIDPYPKNSDSIKAIQELNHHIIDPIIEHFGTENFCLTYGFCSPDLKKFLAQKDPITGIKNGRVAPKIDQHLSYELNKNNQYFCQRRGASCDFLIKNNPSNQVIDWILTQKLPFDSLYYYGENRPIHISYGLEHKRDIWGFTPTGKPTRKNLQHWIKLAKIIP